MRYYGLYEDFINAVFTYLFPRTRLELDSAQTKLRWIDVRPKVVSHRLGSECVLVPSQHGNLATRYHDLCWRRGRRGQNTHVEPVPTNVDADKMATFRYLAHGAAL